MNNLAKLRRARKLTQLEVGKALNIAQSTLSQYERGTRRLDDSLLRDFCDFYQVSSDVILNIAQTNKKSPTAGIKIPVLGEIVAGIPIEAVQDILDYEEISPELAATGEFFALRIKGASMEPRMCEGDVIIVRRQDNADSGDTVVVLVNGDEATVKKIKIQDNGLTLIANNVNVYEPHFYTHEEVKTLPVRIIGKVVEFRGSNKF